MDKIDAKVLITDSIDLSVKEILKEVSKVDILPTMKEEELIKIIPEYDALMIRSSTKVTQKVIDHSRLKIIGRAGVGVDNIDVNAATQRGIIVTNSPDGNTIAAAEHTLALLFSVTRNLSSAFVSTSMGKWERNKFIGKELFSKNLAIIGFGKIGKHVGRVAKTLGMNLLVYDPYSTKEIIESEGGKYYKNLKDILSECDYLTLHVPKNKETTHMINDETLSWMRQGSFIINCSRGGIIDEKALRNALDSKHIAGVGLDVYEDEPNIKNSPIFGCENVCLTPHLGASTKEAQINVAIDVAEQILCVLKGGLAKSAINIPSLSLDKIKAVQEFIPLVEKGWEFLYQISEGKIQEVELVVTGSLCNKNIQPLEMVLLKSLLARSVESVNYVNAPILARQRNISIKTTKNISKSHKRASIEIIAKNRKQELTKIRMSNQDGIPQIVELNGYPTKLPLWPHTLIIPHKNQPAMIASVTSILARHDINIQSMIVLPAKMKEDLSIMIINLSNEISSSLVKEVKKSEGISHVYYVKLKDFK